MTPCEGDYSADELKKAIKKPVELEEKPISQMTPKELDKEIGKCVHRIGILSHEMKKRANE